MAAEARTIADRMHDPDSKCMMLQIAEGYENLAAYAERQAKNERSEGGGGLREHPGGQAYYLEFNSPFHTWVRWHAEDTGSSTMSDNPPQSRFERKNRIREWAYYIWIAAGRPDGYDKVHWEQAEALIGRDDDQASAEHPEGFGTQKSANG